MRNLFKGAALAAGLALASMASPASAAFLITLNSANMDTTYHARIDEGGGHIVEAYSNGVTFSVTNVDAPNATYSLFGFCIDVSHNMYLGNLGYLYSSTYGDSGDPLSTDYGTPAQTLSEDQKDWISTLVDIGFILDRDHRGETSTSIQTAAIQSAIWETIHPGSVQLVGGSASVDGGLNTYQSYFESYVNLKGPGNRIFTITDVRDTPAHQTFAVGWPPEGGVPEPATWGLLIMGFGAAGTMLRRRRVAA